jgi:formylglycine-generating enzyme required for sulfatase activity
MLTDQQKKEFERIFVEDKDGNLTFKAQEGIPSFQLILVEGGKFRIDGKVEKEISTFYIAQFQTTQELYQAVAENKKGRVEIRDSSPSRFQGVNHPVEQVSWEEAVAFCQKLNEICDSDYNLMAKNGKKTENIIEVSGFRLPTDAEWEFAANGGRKNTQTQYSGSNQIDTVAWYDKNNDYETKPVGLKFPNALGIYDMSGNVWEWCWDWYESDFYKNSPSKNPVNLKNGSERVLRGGAWINNAYRSRVAYRSHDSPDYGSFNFGFRLVLPYSSRI